MGSGLFKPSNLFENQKFTSSFLITFIVKRMVVVDMACGWGATSLQLTTIILHRSIDGGIDRVMIWHHKDVAVGRQWRVRKWDEG